LTAVTQAELYCLFASVIVDPNSTAAHTTTGDAEHMTARRRAGHSNGFPRIGRAGWYLIGLLLVAATAWLRLLTDPIFGDVARFLPFIVVIAICTYGGGAGPGLASLAGSVVAGTAFFVDHPFSPRRADLLNILLFASEAGAIALLTAALRRARDRARDLASRNEAALRQRDQFVTRVSHEWRAPLNVLAGWATQLENRPHDSHFVARAATNMLRAIETQKRLVEDLLDYSRGSRGRLSIHPVRLLIATPIEASIEAVRQDGAAKDIAITLDLSDPSLRVWGDNQRLQQVFTNLLSNSIKFTPRGGRVAVRGRRDGELVEIAVEDTGVGIDPHLLQEVFEPFAQGHPARDGALGGLGLGLSITREIVLLHAGTIEASSAGAGRGSTFTVRLPVSAAIAERAVGQTVAGTRRG
jgi:signal transduction histidine kinase